MTLFFHVQFFFQLWHLLPLPASPCHSLRCCSSTPPPPLTELHLHLQEMTPWVTPLPEKWGAGDLSSSICWISRCPRSYRHLILLSSPCTASISPRGSLGALLFFSGTCSSLNLGHFLTCASNNCSISIQCQARVHWTSAGLKVTIKVTLHCVRNTEQIWARY